jgi:hypothetical protein
MKMLESGAVPRAAVPALKLFVVVRIEEIAGRVPVLGRTLPVVAAKVPSVTVKGIAVPGPVNVPVDVAVTISPLIPLVDAAVIVATLTLLTRFPVGAKLRAPAAGRGDTVIVRLVGTELLRVTVPLVPAKAAVEAMKEVTATSPEATKTRPSEFSNIIFNLSFYLG